MNKLDDEVRRARAMFPGNRHLLAACTEELGELAEAMLQDQGVERVRAEALQVACVAMRIFEEGDAAFATDPVLPNSKIQKSRDRLVAGLIDLLREVPDGGPIEQSICTLLDSCRLPDEGKISP